MVEGGSKKVNVGSMLRDDRNRKWFVEKKTFEGFGGIDQIIEFLFNFLSLSRLDERGIGKHGKGNDRTQKQLLLKWL